MNWEASILDILRPAGTSELVEHLLVTPQATIPGVRSIANQLNLPLGTTKRALDHLESYGILESVTVSNRRSYLVRRSNPLLQALATIPTIRQVLQHAIENELPKNLRERLRIQFEPDGAVLLEHPGLAVDAWIDQVPDLATRIGVAEVRYEGPV